VTREEAWNAVHEALPARWRLGPPTYSPADHRWEVCARGETHGRHGDPPITATGFGKDEKAALRDLDHRLRGVPQPDGSRLEELRRRARLAYFQGAVDRCPEMTAAELERVIARAPLPAPRGPGSP
jgi:hypothetical protein